MIARLMKSKVAVLTAFHSLGGKAILSALQHGLDQAQSELAKETIPAEMYALQGEIRVYKRILALPEQLKSPVKQ